MKASFGVQSLGMIVSVAVFEPHNGFFGLIGTEIDLVYTPSLKLPFMNTIFWARNADGANRPSRATQANASGRLNRTFIEVSPLHRGPPGVGRRGDPGLRERVVNFEGLSKQLSRPMKGGCLRNGETAARYSEVQALAEM